MVTSAVLGADVDLSITQQMCAHSRMSILSHTSSIFMVGTLVPPPAPAVKTKVDRSSDEDYCWEQGDSGGSLHV